MKHLALFTLLFFAATPAFAQNGVVPTKNSTSQIPSPVAPKGAIAPLPDEADEKMFDWNSLPENMRSTKEQLEAEAQTVYTACSQDAYQNKLYSCECISGAFLQMREKVGPVPLMEDLMGKVLQSTKPNCANKPMIAMKTLINCMSLTGKFKEEATDSEEVCRCQAYVVATEFEKKPIPDPAYIQALNGYADDYCDDPAHWPAHVDSKAPAPDPNGIKIPQQQ